MSFFFLITLIYLFIIIDNVLSLLFFTTVCDHESNNRKEIVEHLKFNNMYSFFEDRKMKIKIIILFFLLILNCGFEGVPHKELIRTSLQICMTKMP